MLKNAMSSEPKFNEASGAWYHKPVRPDLGLYGEVSTMIVQNMNLADCSDLILDRLNFLGRFTYTHENCHSILGALEYTHPQLMEGHHYQGDHWAESYVLALQYAIESAGVGQVGCYNNQQDWFTSIVRSKSWRWGGDRKLHESIELSHRRGIWHDAS